MVDEPDARTPASDRPKLRHYLRRKGRITQGQARALELHERRVLLLGDATPEQRLQPAPDWPRLFSANPTADLGVEIGFGMGQAFVQWSQDSSDMNLVGIEVYQPGIGSALLQAQQADVLERVYIVEAEARATLQLAFAAQSLREIRIFFPDPWPKARHHKRRLLQPEFVRLLASRLQPGGSLRVATDWQEYAQWILTTLEQEPALTNVAGAGRYAPRFAGRDVTRFEARGHRLGHDVWDFHYQA